MTRNLRGHCACGAVRYHFTSMPMFVHCCHCLDCQRQTGSAFVINGLIEADRIVIESGDPRPISMPTESGRPHDIYRCPECQTAMWSDYGGRPYLRFARTGTLENPAGIVPDVHIFTRSKLPWVTIPPDVPAFEIFYDMKTLWPSEAQERRRMASAGARR